MLREAIRAEGRVGSTRFGYVKEGMIHNRRCDSFYTDSFTSHVFTFGLWHYCTRILAVNMASCPRDQCTLGTSHAILADLITTKAPPKLIIYFTGCMVPNFGIVPPTAQMPMTFLFCLLQIQRPVAAKRSTDIISPQGSRPNKPSKTKSEVDLPVQLKSQAASITSQMEQPQPTHHVLSR